MSDDLDNVVAAGAFGLAAYHLQNAMLSTLVAKGALSMNEASLIFSGAIRELDQRRPDPSPSDLGTLARRILEAGAAGWGNQAKGH